MFLMRCYHVMIRFKPLNIYFNLMPSKLTEHTKHKGAQNYKNRNGDYHFVLISRFIHLVYNLHVYRFMAVHVRKRKVEMFKVSC